MKQNKKCNKSKLKKITKNSIIILITLIITITKTPLIIHTQSNDIDYTDKQQLSPIGDILIKWIYNEETTSWEMIINPESITTNENQIINQYSNDIKNNLTSPYGYFNFFTQEFEPFYIDIQPMLAPAVFIPPAVKVAKKAGKASLKWWRSRRAAQAGMTKFKMRGANGFTYWSQGNVSGWFINPQTGTLAVGTTIAGLHILARQVEDMFNDQFDPSTGYWSFEELRFFGGVPLLNSQMLPDNWVDRFPTRNLTERRNHEDNKNWLSMFAAQQAIMIDGRILTSADASNNWEARSFRYDWGGDVGFVGMVTGARTFQIRHFTFGFYGQFGGWRYENNFNQTLNTDIPAPYVNLVPLRQPNIITSPEQTWSAIRNYAGLLPLPIYHPYINPANDRRPIIITFPADSERFLDEFPYTEIHEFIVPYEIFQQQPGWEWHPTLNPGQQPQPTPSPLPSPSPYPPQPYPPTYTGYFQAMLHYLRQLATNVANLPSTIRDAISGAPQPDVNVTVEFDIYGEPVTPGDWTPNFIFDFSPILDNMPNLLEYFPFSLPFDFYNTVRVAGGMAPVQSLGLTASEIRQLNANGIELQTIQELRAYLPRFTIDVPEPFNYEFVFDMNEWSRLVTMIRWSLLVMFAFALYKITPRIIAW